MIVGTREEWLDFWYDFISVCEPYTLGSDEEFLKALESKNDELELIKEDK